MTIRTYAHLSPIAEAGGATGQPYSAVAGAAIAAALEDAHWGSREARAWPRVSQGRRWIEQLGGDGYLEQAQEEWY